MLIKTDGIVIKESSYSEKDKIISVLTSDLGVIRAFAKGCKNNSNRNFSAAQILNYSEFVFFNKKDIYTLREASLKNSFLGIRNSFESLIISQYICESVLYLVKENMDSKNVLRLVLNSIYALTNSKFNKRVIKSVFEIKLLAVLGYQLEFSRCKFCKKNLNCLCYFYFDESGFICENCFKCLSLYKKKQCMKTNASVINALAYSTDASYKSMFSFNLQEENLKNFSSLTQKYLNNHIEKPMKTLKMYEKYFFN